MSETNIYLSTSSGGCTGWTVLKPLQPAGENDASRGRWSGEQSQSVTKLDRRMGRRQEQRTVGIMQSEWKGMIVSLKDSPHQA